MNKIFRKVLPCLIVALTGSVSGLVSACDNPFEGTYSVLSLDGKNVLGTQVTVTVGGKTFALSSGASGFVEASGNKLIFSGNSFTGVFTPEGKNLKSERWKLVRVD